MNIQKILQENGLKATKSRVALIALLEKVDQPVDAHHIFHQLKDTKIAVDLATVYRILEKFLSLGIVKQIDFREGKLRYELAGDHHHHLVCQDCGDIKPFHGKCLGEVEKVIEQHYKFRVTEHILEFFGKCQKCQSGKTI
jgi:Fur family ferric uptake transcriptional regulator